jgi:formylglycine-generating enzyme required for sulfatase activity
MPNHARPSSCCTAFGALIACVCLCAHGSAGEAATPAWAMAAGADASGNWADLAVAGMTQRFRLIAPGTFTMGSSEAERQTAVSKAAIKAAWIASEVPHQVTLTHGFWLADSACTQALWLAVLGANPSNFTGDVQRPVEQVSWDDCQRFLTALNARQAGAAFRLPSEAEWEYACRAGTTTATYAGDIVYLGQNNGPVLDAIAWYGGNSGVPAEVATAIDSSLWSERQYPSDFSATHPVKLKRPNAWGLYDMIGNVWTWCGDWYGDYPTGAVSDPHGPATGSDHVCRGGSWGQACWYCRAAERIGNAPGSRWNSLGLRLCADGSANR